MTTRLKKFYEAICKYPKIIFSWFFSNSPTGFFWLSGLKHIVRKFQGIKDETQHPTGVLWAIALYAAIFGIASQIYENHLDRLENRASILITALLNKETGKLAVLQIDEIKEKEIPVKPVFLEPLSVFRSLLGVKEVDQPTIQRLNEAEDLLYKNLAGRDLSGRNFRNANLEWGNLKDANLKDANLERANLFRAELNGANLTDADLTDAILTDANLRDAILTRADLTDAILKGAVLGGANLQGASLTGANLQDAILNGANLRKADLKGANLKGANLSRAYLRGANLFKAELNGANLTDADLTDAILTDAILTDAILIRADLKGADLRKAGLGRANLTGANLQGARYLTCEQVTSGKFFNEKTKFPDYLKIKIIGENKGTCEKSQTKSK